MTEGLAGDATRRRARLGLVALLLVLVGLSLFPFRLDAARQVPNDVEVGADGQVAFDRFNRMRSEGPQRWLSDVSPDDSVTVELDLRPADVEQTGPARVLAVSSDPDNADVVVGQERRDVVVRVRRAGSDPSGWPDLRVPDVLSASEWTSVRITVEPDRVGVDVDGVALAAEDVSVPPVSTWDRSYTTALGDEVDGGRPWAGQLRRATITTPTGTADLLAPGVLDVPESYRYEPRRGWEPALPVSVPDALVDLLHALAFVPVGALLALALPRARIAPLLLATLVLTFALTASKMFFESRHPSLSDPVVETVGSLIGLLIVRRLARPSGRARYPETASLPSISLLASRSGDRPAAGGGRAEP